MKILEIRITNKTRIVEHTIVVILLNADLNLVSIGPETTIFENASGKNLKKLNRLPIVAY
jgi:hypothetical protein